MPTPDYPPLPEADVFVQYGSGYAWFANKMHAYLATERTRIEREVMPLIERYVAENNRCNSYNATLVHLAILRAIRGEKEPK